MPGRLDQNRPFLPVNIALLTVSDTRDAAQDRSGNTLADTLAGLPRRVSVGLVNRLADVDDREAYRRLAPRRGF